MHIAKSGDGWDLGHLPPVLTFTRFDTKSLVFRFIPYAFRCIQARLKKTKENS